MKELVCHGLPAMINDSSKKYLCTIERDKPPIPGSEMVSVGGGIVNKSVS